MKIVISPAKTLDMNPISKALIKSTQPLFSQQSAQLVEQLKSFETADIRKLMGVSQNIAALNQLRYQQWKQPFNTINAKPALLAFKGDVYQGMNVVDFTKQDFEFAQKNLRILSGLYGCLRPMDLIQAYRLEMGTSLKNIAGNSLYDFWSDAITAYLNEELATSKSKVLVNLASQEYFKSIEVKNLKADIVTPVFKDYKNGQYKIISFSAKKARGMMCSYIIQNQIIKPSEMIHFNKGGYHFDEKQSTENQFVFLRK